MCSDPAQAQAWGEEAAAAARGMLGVEGTTRALQALALAYDQGDWADVEPVIPDDTALPEAEWDAKVQALLAEIRERQARGKP